MMTGTEADNGGTRDTDLFCERHRNHYELNFHHCESGETEHFSEPRETEVKRTIASTKGSCYKE